jgi:hypothetical protein
LVKPAALLLVVLAYGIHAMGPQEAYEKVKDYIRRWKEDYKVFQMTDPDQARDLLKDPAKALERVKSLRTANEKHLIYWNLPRKWSQVEREALARLASSDEPMEYRGSAIGLIGHCQMTEFTDLLVDILQRDPDWSARSCAVDALGQMGVRDVLPLLYYAAIDYERDNGLWVGRFAARAIYRVLFQFWPDTRKYGTKGSIDAAHSAWWQKNRPTEELLFAWARGKQLPEDDGFGNPRRDDVKYAHLYDLDTQLRRMREAWHRLDGRQGDGAAADPE